MQEGNDDRMNDAGGKKSLIIRLKSNALVRNELFWNKKTLD